MNRAFFGKLDVEKSGYLSKTDFKLGFEKYFSGIDVETEFIQMDIDKVNHIILILN